MQRRLNAIRGKLCIENRKRIPCLTRIYWRDHKSPTGVVFLPPLPLLPRYRNLASDRYLWCTITGCPGVDLFSKKISSSRAMVTRVFVLSEARRGTGGELEPESLFPPPPHQVKSVKFLRNGRLTRVMDRNGRILGGERSRTGGGEAR